MDAIEQARQRVLILQCQLGSRPALEELYLRHNRPLGYYLRRMLGRDDVGDVQQEVWLAVIRRIGGLRTPEAFVVWFFQIARNKAFKLLGDRRSLHSLVDEQAPFDPVNELDTEFTPDDAAGIHEALAHLNPAHREVLVLRFMEDLSYEQIAAVVNCNTGTVRSRLHYAKQALRQQLEKTS
jgi:RNA polymerase sigma-70 factor, ECF subfamily